MRKYDLSIIWNSASKEKFIKWVRKECALRGLRFLLVNEKNIGEIIQQVEKGTLKLKFLLDNEANYAEPSNSFARLCFAVKDAGGYVVCDPDHARAASNKAIAHYDLFRARVPVPYTVVVRNWEPDDFTITKNELAGLGTPFIIKPATGFGQKGIIKNATGSISEIVQARHFDRGDDFLLQKKIEPIFFGRKQGWFRVYFLFGEIIPCWWNTETGEYVQVTLREMYNLKLLPLVRISSEIARITGMDFFSCEIAITGKEKQFVAIDYVNDQPHLCIHPDKGGLGPLSEVVHHIALRIAEIAWRVTHDLPLEIYRSIWLAKAETEDKTI